MKCELFIERLSKPSCSFLFLSCLVLGLSVKAQDFVYAKGIQSSLAHTGTVISRSIESDVSGHTYITGSFTGVADFDPGVARANLSSAGLQDIFIAKYDPMGNYIYAKAIGGSGIDEGYDIDIDGSGNVYITGTFTGSADFDPGTGTENLVNVGATDIFIAKYDPAGNYIYAKTIGGTGADLGNTIAVDGAGKVWISGAFSGTVDFDPSDATANLTSAGDLDIFIAGYDASGDYVYAKRIGGTGNDVCLSLAVDGNGNTYVTGYFIGTVDFDPGEGEASFTSNFGSYIFIARYDGSGNYVYANGTGGLSINQGTGIAVDGDENVYVTGVFVGALDCDPGAGVAELRGAGNLDVFIARYDHSGNYVYAKALGGLEREYSTGIVIDDSANVFVTGGFTGRSDFDPGPGVVNLSNAGSDDIFVAKYDALGNYSYAKAIASAGSEIATGITHDGLGNTYITGSFAGVVDFDPGAGIANLAILGSGRDGFISALNASGNHVIAMQLGTYPLIDLSDMGFDIAADKLGNTFITGYFAGGADFYPGDGEASLTSTLSSRDIFIASYDVSGRYRYAIRMGGLNTDVGNSIAVDDSGNVYVTGYFSGTVDFDPGGGEANLAGVGGTDIFLAKFDASGNYVYAKVIGGTGDDRGNGIAVDGLGNVVVTGAFMGTVDFDPGPGVDNLVSKGRTDSYLARYDVTGKLVYAKGIGGTNLCNSSAIAFDGSGSSYITGGFVGTADFDPGDGVVNLTSAGSSDVFIAKYDVYGNYKYAKAFGNSSSSDDGYAIAVDGVGSAYISGKLEVILISGIFTANFFARYDPHGNELYRQTLPADRGGPQGSGIETDGSGNVYITGFFDQSGDFDPGPGVANLINTTNSPNIFIAKYDSAGRYIYAKGIGSTGRDYGYGIALDSLQNVYVTGSLEQTVNFDPGNSSTNTIITASGSAEIYIAKYGPSGSLPIDLLSFTAKPVNNGTAVRLNWSTASQTNNAFFEVERSKDGIHFEAIARRPGCMTCTSLQQYELIDSIPFIGTSYYRLKQVDLDHLFSYSQTIPVNISATANSTIRVYPSITNGAYEVAISNSSSRKQVVISLLNASGSLLKQQTVSLHEGGNRLQYSLSDQASGVYYVSVADKESRSTSTVIVIKK